MFRISQILCHNYVLVAKTQTFLLSLRYLCSCPQHVLLVDTRDSWYRQPNPASPTDINIRVSLCLSACIHITFSCYKWVQILAHIVSLGNGLALVIHITEFRFQMQIFHSIYNLFKLDSGVRMHFHDTPEKNI